ncbi:MAG TPA: DUF58 domain-containing protein [Nitriliruptorales bacterium]|nr:DUF58 domain-containing protein [Nitriliruptorales bacterium]
MDADPRLLPPEVLTRLARLRLATRRRVHGRYAGGHTSRRHGSSLDFADHREYVAGDDPRRLDVSAYQRLGRLLVRLYEAEDEAAVRIVVDLSASMGFGRKAAAAREIAAALTAVAANGQDRVRVLVATRNGVDAGPWYRGPSALPAVESRLLAAVPDGATPVGARPGTDSGAAHGADLRAVLARAHGEGPVGPVVLVSDLLFEGWEQTLLALASGRGDALLVHLLGRDDLEPSLRGDLRLADAETGAEVEVGIAEQALADHAAARDRWLAEVEAVCGRRGIAYALLTDDVAVEELVTGALRRLGVVV